MIRGNKGSSSIIGDICSSSCRSAVVTTSQQQQQHSATVVQRRGIRSVIPPRPAVTSLMYLDIYGRAVQSKAQETPLSLVRTRGDNRFWLQRVFPTGEVVRWRARGLERLKHATNLENYSLNDMDEHGGIIVPQDVMPHATHDPPTYLDAVYYLMRSEPGEKVTRKTRRQWHRRIYAHWKESPEKYFTASIQNYVIPTLVVIWLVQRVFYSIRNKKPFWDVDVYHEEGKNDYVDPMVRLGRFAMRHPEQEGYDDRMITMMSPAQSRLSSARAELRESDITDPHFHSQFWWKMRHCWYYGHWPKGLTSTD